MNVMDVKLHGSDLMALNAVSSGPVLLFLCSECGPANTYLHHCGEKSAQTYNWTQIYPFRRPTSQLWRFCFSIKCNKAQRFVRVHHVRDLMCQSSMVYTHICSQRKPQSKSSKFLHALKESLKKTYTMWYDSSIFFRTLFVYKNFTFFFF